MGRLHKRHIHCELCESSDAVSVWLEANNHFVAKCFSCKQSYQCDEEGHRVSKGRKASKQQASKLAELEYARVKLPDDLRVCTWKSAGVDRQLAKMYGVMRDTEGRVYFPYYHNSQRVGLKVRNYSVPKKDKFHFYVVGTTAGLFYGQQLYERNFKRLLIVEGEWDTLAAKAMLQDSKYTSSVAVVGVAGTDSLDQAIRNNYEWLESFESITLCMDGDRQGRGAAKAALDVLPPVDTRIMILDEGDDPRSLCQEGRWRYFQNKYQQAPGRKLPRYYNTSWLDEAYDTDDVADPFVSGVDFFDDMLSGGVRPGGVSVILADPGHGKSTLSKVVVAGLLKNDVNCAVVSLEEEPRRFMRHLLNAYTNGEEVSKEKLRHLEPRCPVYNLVDGFDIDRVLKFIKLSVVQAGTDVVVIDTLTKLCHTDMTLTVKAMEELDNLSKQLGIHIMVLGHQARGKKFEDLAAGVGSGAIERYAEVIIKMKREGDRVMLRVAKDRPCGEYNEAVVVFDKEVYEYQTLEEVQLEQARATDIPEVSTSQQEVEEDEGDDSPNPSARLRRNDKRRRTLRRNKRVHKADDENMVADNGKSPSPADIEIYRRIAEGGPRRKQRRKRDNLPDVS